MLVFHELYSTKESLAARLITSGKKA